MPKTRIINFTNMYYKHIRENKTLANISEFTVFLLQLYNCSKPTRCALSIFENLTTLLFILIGEGKYLPLKACPHRPPAKRH